MTANSKCHEKGPPEDNAPLAPQTSLPPSLNRSWPCRPADLIGSIIPILHIPLSARPLIEGQAELIAAVPELPGVFEVRFVDEARPVRRFIGSCLLNRLPYQTLADLGGHWRLAGAPELLLPDPCWQSRISPRLSGE